MTAWGGQDDGLERWLCLSRRDDGKGAAITGVASRRRTNPLSSECIFRQTRLTGPGHRGRQRRRLAA